MKVKTKTFKEPAKYTFGEWVDICLLYTSWATDKNGKSTKQPFAAGGGPTGTDDKWSHTWVTYNEAVKAKEHNPVAAGIGFKIPKGYYFIDIDHKDVYKRQEHE